MGGRGSGRKAGVGFELARGTPPWERQPDETDKAFGAFRIYRDLGSERTSAKTVTALGKKPGYARVCEAWSTKFGWRVRTAAWDSHVDKREREAVVKARQRKAVEKLQVADGLWKTAAKGLVMWSQYLDHHNAMKPNTVPPISASEVHKLAEAGMKLSELLEGRPTEITEGRVTVEDRRSRMQEIIANPKLRSAMRDATNALKETKSKSPDPHGSGNGNGRALH